MNKGKDLVALATELQALSARKTDFLADTSKIAVDVVDKKVVFGVEGIGTFQATRHAIGQAGEFAGIPAKYVDRMTAEAPQLLATNFRHWFQEQPAARMLRTLNPVPGTADAAFVRAFLSDRYRRLDNEDVAEASLPVLMESADIQVVSTEVTESRLYLKAIFPKVQAEVRRGDVVQAGVVISNSEIGLGSLSVSPLIYRLVCTNGLISSDEAWRKYHVGRVVEAVDMKLALRDETKAAQDKALLLTLQDAVRAASAEAFQRTVAKMQEAAGGEVVERPIKAVEVLTRSVGLLKSESDSVLERLIRGQDYTRYGVLNAITNLANDVKDYDRATELEIIGGRMLDLSPSQWQQIAKAA